MMEVCYLGLFSDFNSHYLRTAVVMTAAVADHIVFHLFLKCSVCYFFNRTTLGKCVAKKVSQSVDHVENLVEKSMQWNP